jgi:two-component system nitrogen regulation sensor histidine kinase NtrY
VVTIDTSGQIKTFNKAAENIFSVRPEDVLDRRYETLLRPEHSRVVERMLRQLEEGRVRTVRQEIPIMVRGKAMILSLNASNLVDANSETIGFVIVMEDLTELVNAQKKAAWSEVAKRIAHEIKNPLTPIKLSAERIRRKLLGRLERADDRVIDESTESIIREVEGMRGLVDEFSQFARMPILRSVPGDINVVVREAVGPYMGSAAPERIALHLSENLPQVSFDAEQMRRVVVNLLENAVRAVHDRGQGIIDVDTGFTEEEGMIAVEVSDEGVGIPSEMRERIFDPYFTTKSDGTGLGLAIAMRIVEEHGGTITFSENKPQGSIFRVMIPVNIEPDV